GRPPEQTEMPADSKHLLEEAIILKHRPEIGRVIFMSTPHRGSDLASNWIGRIGSMLVKTPSKLITIGQTIREAATPDPAALQMFPRACGTSELITVWKNPDVEEVAASNQKTDFPNISCAAGRFSLIF